MEAISIFLKYLASFILALAVIGGWGMTIIGMPGTIPIFAGVLVYGLLTGWETVGWSLLLALALMMLVAETGDNLLSIYGAKKSGTSRKGQVAAIVGGIGGGILGALVLGAVGVVGIVTGVVLSAAGGVLGAIMGGFVVVYAVELRAGKLKLEARRAATGAVVGRAAGQLLRVAITFAMMVLLAATLWGRSAP